MQYRRAVHKQRCLAFERKEEARLVQFRVQPEVCPVDRPIEVRVGQRKQVDNYPFFAWSSPIWVTRGSE